MTESERQSPSDREEPDQVQPALSLSTPLASVLCTAGPTAMLYHAIEHRTDLLVKVPDVQINSLRGSPTMVLRHFLYRHPAAPVIRSVLTISDQHSQPTMAETFVNVADEKQREEFFQLGRQDHLRIHFFDEQLSHRLSKKVGAGPQPEALDLIRLALRLIRDVPPGQYDFSRAKRAVLEATIASDDPAT